MKWASPGKFLKKFQLYAARSDKVGRGKDEPLFIEAGAASRHLEEPLDLPGKNTFAPQPGAEAGVV